MGLHDCGQFARAVSRHASGAANNDKAKSGSIIYVSFVVGGAPLTQTSSLRDIQLGLEGFTQTLAAEARWSNIRVNSDEPGYVATKLTGYGGSKPESVTEIFVYLASDEAKEITGKMFSSSAAPRTCRHRLKLPPANVHRSDDRGRKCCMSLGRNYMPNSSTILL